MAGTFLSVVIPSYNGRSLLATCLPAVFRAISAAGVSAEVVVVDDASSDGTAEWCAKTWPAVRVARLSENGGFARAANAGAAARSGEWIAMLNNDAVPDAGWIAGASLDRRAADVAAVASKIVYARNRRIVESAGDGYTVAGLAYQGLNGRTEDGAGESRRVFSACAAAAFYRRTAFEEAGGFDEKFESYYEDVDLAFRLNLLGWQVLYEPRSVSFHGAGKTYGANPARRIRNSARNSETVFFSCMPAALLVRCIPRHVAAVFAQAVLRAWQGRLTPFVLGKLDFLRHIPFVLARRRAVQAARRADIRSLNAVIDPKWLRRHILERAGASDDAGSSRGRLFPAAARAH